MKCPPKWCATTRLPFWLARAHHRRPKRPSLSTRQHMGPLITQYEYPAADAVPPEEHHRRSLYTFIKRNALHPSLQLFDFPDRNDSASRRRTSNTPLRSLTLLNDPQYIEAYRVMAARVMRMSSEQPMRLETLFRLARRQRPSPEQTAILDTYLNSQRERFASDPAAAKKLLAVGVTPVDLTVDPLELAALTNVAELVIEFTRCLHDSMIACGCDSREEIDKLRHCTTEDIGRREFLLRSGAGLGMIAAAELLGGNTAEAAASVLRARRPRESGAAWIRSDARAGRSAVAIYAHAGRNLVPRYIRLQAVAGKDAWSGRYRLPFEARGAYPPCRPGNLPFRSWDRSPISSNAAAAASWVSDLLPISAALLMTCASLRRCIPNT